MFTTDLRNTGATCSVFPGSRCHQTGSTALRGSPWIPPDSPEGNDGKNQSEVTDRVGLEKLTGFPDRFPHLDVAGAVRLVWSHTVVSSISPACRKSNFRPENKFFPPNTVFNRLNSQHRVMYVAIKLFSCAQSNSWS